MKKLGLTGVMGAGKSSVIEILKQKTGSHVLDCDAINASLLEKGEEGYTQIIAHFGSGLLDDDGNINKQKMSHEIFKNPLNKTSGRKNSAPFDSKKNHANFE